jgi:Flp pilus assembly protein TadG
VAAIETAFLLPAFLLLVLSIVQLGIYFMMQSALDSGVLNTAAALRANVAIGSSYTPPAAGSLKASIVSKGSGILSTAIVTTDLRQLVNMTSAAVPIADGFTDWGGSGSILVLRAHATMNWYLPSAISVAVDSMAIVRRPNY